MPFVNRTRATFAQGRVRLLGRLCVHAGADATPLRRGLQRRRGRLVTGGRAPLANKLIKSRQTETPYPKTLETFTSRAQSPSDHSRPRRHSDRGGARKPSSCCFASVFVQTSDENRDGGRAFSPSSRKSQLRFAVPACIALQGGERADTVAIRPCPSQEKSHSGDLSGRQTSPDRRNQNPSLKSDPGFPYASNR